VVEAERFAILTSEATISIPKGGRVTIYTDGVTEAKDRQGRDFGVEALHQLAAEIPEEDSETFVQSLLTAIYAHRKDAPPSDDIAVVTFRRSF
jgi:sigma-B regulation protein RsbU (phosphoserine phosphatase)